MHTERHSVVMPKSIHLDRRSNVAAGIFTAKPICCDINVHCTFRCKTGPATCAPRCSSVSNGWTIISSVTARKPTAAMNAVVSFTCWRTLNCTSKPFTMIDHSLCAIIVDRRWPPQLHSTPTTKTVAQNQIVRESTLLETIKLEDCQRICSLLNRDRNYGVPTVISHVCDRKHWNAISIKTIRLVIGRRWPNYFAFGACANSKQSKSRPSILQSSMQPGSVTSARRIWRRISRWSAIRKFTRPKRGRSCVRYLYYTWLSYVLIMTNILHFELLKTIF